MLDPFMVLRIGMVLTVTLCWVADKPYRAFAWAMSFLALAKLPCRHSLHSATQFSAGGRVRCTMVFGYCLRAIAT